MVLKLKVRWTILNINATLPPLYKKFLATTLVDSSQTVLEHHGPFNSLDDSTSSQTVLELKKVTVRYRYSVKF